VKVIVGLGNPGRKYEHTRHNIGFEVVAELARAAAAEFRRGWLSSASTARVRLKDGGELLLVKPQTFMNRSGTAVAPLLRKKGLKPADLVVVVDDADLEPGRLRIRKQGGAGGHNGLKSLIQELGTDEFVRVRVGIGRDPAGTELVDHVLTRFAPHERETMDAAVRQAAEAVREIARAGADAAMNKFN